MSDCCFRSSAWRPTPRMAIPTTRRIDEWVSLPGRCGEWGVARVVWPHNKVNPMIYSFGVVVFCTSVASSFECWTQLMACWVWIITCFLLLFLETPLKTNGWTAQMMGLGKGDSLYKYSHVWYQFLKMSRILTDFHRTNSSPPIRIPSIMPFRCLGNAGGPSWKNLERNNFHWRWWTLDTRGVFAKFGLKLAVDT